MGIDIISRSEWGAKYPNGFDDRPMPVEEVWLHHSVTIAPDLLPPFTDDDAAVRTLELIGQQRFGGGISYTWPITPVGRVYEGHSVHRRGAHTGGHNTAGAAICFVGDYSSRTPTSAQVEAAAQLLAQEYRAGRIKYPRLNGGHRDTKSTDCPGDGAYAVIGTINARAAVILGEAPEKEETHPPLTEVGEEMTFMLQIRKGDEQAGALFFCGPGFAHHITDGSDDKELRANDKLPVHTLSKAAVDSVVAQIRAR